jgi:Domain of unknown function (DUF4189)
MRHTPLIVVVISALAMGLAGGSAFAEYGAVAYDTASGKPGFGWNNRTQLSADTKAVRQCASAGCKVVFRVGPRRCGALATSENGKVWGAAARATRDAAALGALQNCQKRASGKCVVQGAGCNR